MLAEGQDEFLLCSALIKALSKQLIRAVIIPANQPVANQVASLMLTFKMADPRGEQPLVD